MKDKARAFAIERHGDQKYGEHPYSVHLDEVADIASVFGQDAITVAYLHDVVEDTHTTLDEIESEFGPLIRDYVAILTDEPGDSRKERKAKTYGKMAKVSERLKLALIVKAADRLANLKTCLAQNNQGILKMYREEHPMFYRAAYRPNLCDSLWNQMNAIVNTE